MKFFFFGCLQVSEELLWELFVQAGPVGRFDFSHSNSIIYIAINVCNILLSQRKCSFYVEVADLN